MTSQRVAHFIVFLTSDGYHEAGWRIHEFDGSDPIGLQSYIRSTAICERGLLDAAFFADRLALTPFRARAFPQTHHDPVQMLAALAVGSSRVGLIATASTTFSNPWDLARRFATLDHISAGRIGWNVVTTYDPNAAENFGVSLPEHDDRYARATEFVEVAKRLWDSWEDGALIVTRPRGSGLTPIASTPPLSTATTTPSPAHCQCRVHLKAIPRWRRRVHPRPGSTWPARPLTSSSRLRGRSRRGSRFGRRSTPRPSGTAGMWVTFESCLGWGTCSAAPKPKPEATPASGGERRPHVPLADAGHKRRVGHQQDRPDPAAIGGGCSKRPAYELRQEHCRARASDSATLQRARRLIHGASRRT